MNTCSLWQRLWIFYDIFWDHPLTKTYCWWNKNGVSKNRVLPQNGWFFIMEHPYWKCMIWGDIPLFCGTSKSGDHHLGVGAKTYVKCWETLSTAGDQKLHLTMDGWKRIRLPSFWGACKRPIFMIMLVFSGRFFGYFGTHFNRVPSWTSRPEVQCYNPDPRQLRRGGKTRCWRWVGNKKSSSRLKIWNLISWS